MVLVSCSKLLCCIDGCWKTATAVRSPIVGFQNWASIWYSSRAVPLHSKQLYQYDIKVITSIRKYEQQFSSYLCLTLNAFMKYVKLTDINTQLQRQIRLVHKSTLVRICCFSFFHLLHSFFTWQFLDRVQ